MIFLFQINLLVRGLLAEFLRTPNGSLRFRPHSTTGPARALRPSGALDLPGANAGGFSYSTSNFPAPPGRQKPLSAQVH